MIPREITFTLDLEDHRPHPGLPRRYDLMTDRLLTFLDDGDVRATVFCVATLAQQSPQLIRKIHQAGHEIALHAFDHTPLDRQTPAVFKDHTRRGQAILEDLIGQGIMGYRAPVFSLTRRTLWAVDCLRDLGFCYSSSTLPAPNPLYGFPELPRTPFFWSNGLLELPSPVSAFGPFNLPYLGGFYFRYLPAAIVKNRIARSGRDDALWFYCHPYDFDHEERNIGIKGASSIVSLLLWFNRKNTLRKLQLLIDKDVIRFGPPFAEQILSGRFDRIGTRIDPHAFEQSQNKGPSATPPELRKNKALEPFGPSIKR